MRFRHLLTGCAAALMSVSHSWGIVPVFTSPTEVGDALRELGLDFWEVDVDAGEDSFSDAALSSFEVVAGGDLLTFTRVDNRSNIFGALPASELFPITVESIASEARNLSVIEYQASDGFIDPGLLSLGQPLVETNSVDEGGEWLTLLDNRDGGMTTMNTGRLLDGAFTFAPESEYDLYFRYRDTRTGLTVNFEPNTDEAIQVFQASDQFRTYFLTVFDDKFLDGPGINLKDDNDYDDYTALFTIQTAQIPEPETYALMFLGSGMFVFLLLRRHMRR